jgi:hypothetical protein
MTDFRLNGWGFPAWPRFFSFLCDTQINSGHHPASYPTGTGVICQGIKWKEVVNLATPLHVLASCLIEHRDNFTFCYIHQHTSTFQEADLVGKQLLKYLHMYEARPQSKFPTCPTASKPYIAQSDCSYVIEQWCSMAHALTVLPAFSQ